MTRYVIHNHIPAKRTKDSGGAFLGAAPPKEGDPDYKRWVEQQRAQQNRGGGGFRNNDAREVNPAAIGREFAGKPQKELEREIMHLTPAQKSIALEAYKKASSQDKWGKRDSVGVVNRDQEERNRDRMYRDAGIKRI